MGKIINKKAGYVEKIFSKEKRTLHHTPNGRKLVSVDTYVHRKTAHNGGNVYNKFLLGMKQKAIPVQ